MTSKPDIKKPGAGGSLLAPSKFGANFGRADNKRLFTGLKASKLTSITQSVCSSSTSTQPQQNPATQTASGTVASSKPFGDPNKPSQPSSTCTPVIAKVTLNTAKLPSSSPEKKETDETPKDALNVEIKAPETNKNESSGFVFGQNCADRAENFVETSGEDKIGGSESFEGNKTNLQSSTGFVFGQNLADRVSNADNDSEKNKSENEKHSEVTSEESKLSSSESSDKDTTVSSNLESTSSETKSLSPGKEISNATSTKNHDIATTQIGKTLHENAAEYFESHLAPPKRKFDEVEVITGEENEHNVLHMSAKLYIFDKNKSWLEKGRGELRLNDLSVAAANASNTTGGLTGNQGSRDVKRKVMSSRIVMRTVGSLRVILNTKVYHGMSVEKPNEKSVRLTGIDDGGVVKVFLVTSSPKDTDALHCALKSRLAELKSTQEDNKLESEESNTGEKCSDTCNLEKPDVDGVSSSKKSKIDL